MSSSSLGLATRLSLANPGLVDGNPLENIANAHKVKRVIANGRLFDLDALLKSR